MYEHHRKCTVGQQLRMTTLRNEKLQFVCNSVVKELCQLETILLWCLFNGFQLKQNVDKDGIKTENKKRQ